jgi:hypothetical protein
MGKRIGIDTYEDMLAHAKLTFANGLINGKGIGDIVSDIMYAASAYGADEAERSQHFMASVDETDFQELIRENVFTTVERLFAGTRLASLVAQVVLAGAAFGFQTVRPRKASTGAP